MHGFVEAIDPDASLSGIAFIRPPGDWRFYAVRRKTPIKTEAKVTWTSLSNTNKHKATPFRMCTGEAACCTFA
ncbi:MAG: hypothetical protein AAGU26_04510 [bacterium]|jgi:hypothetical protein|nr:hypothetical protein TRIP_E280062 [uncultured Spirochaetota bacterium]